MVMAWLIMYNIEKAVAYSNWQSHFLWLRPPEFEFRLEVKVLIHLS
jgi:hypothetical protein